jgi:hypothetical protein
MTNDGCAALGACERACATGDDACLLACELARPSAVPAERTFGQCLREKCPHDCIPPEWACLETAGSAPKPATGANITIGLTFVEYPSYPRVPGLTLQACKDAGGTCTAPVGPSVTDASGYGELHLAENSFEGFIDVTGPGYAHMLLYLPRLTSDFAAIVGVVNVDTFQGLASAIPPPPPDSGSVLVTVFDCAGGAAGGVKLAIDPADGVTPFYFAQSNISLTATMTDADPDTGAYGGFLGVKTHTGITIRASVAENGLSYAPRTVYAVHGDTTYTQVLLYAAAP